MIANFESKRNGICGKAFLIEGGNRGQPYSVGEGLAIRQPCNACQWLDGNRMVTYLFLSGALCQI